jgi:hypothetical protein
MTDGHNPDLGVENGIADDVGTETRKFAHTELYGAASIRKFTQAFRESNKGAGRSTRGGRAIVLQIVPNGDEVFARLI